MGQTSALRVLLAVAVAAAAGTAAARARAQGTDSGVLNRTVAQDAVGDAVGGGPDVSSLTITTYSDGSVSFVVEFANRDRLHVNESVQLDIDVNDDGIQDLDMSVWGNGLPSYLYATPLSGGWRIVRQLPELAQNNGSLSVRLSLSELRDAAGVPFGIPAIGVDAAGKPLGPSLGARVLTWAGATPADFLPEPGGLPFIDHEIDPAATPAPTTTTTTTTTTTVPTETPPPGSLGKTVLVRRRTRTSGCEPAALPDRRCSPGAYYSGLTKAALCSSSFHTSTAGNLTASEKRQVEVEYGLRPKDYGRTLEIDHIIPLELGGSNDIANLYPERAAFANHAPGYRVKDELENELHALVCSGAMNLRAAQRAIASNWERLYKRVFAVAP